MPNLSLLRQIVLLALLASAIIPDLVAQQRDLSTRGLDRKLSRYVAPLIDSLDPRPKRVLDRIRSSSRRLLAVRYYMIRGHQVDSLWTWSQRQAGEFKASPDFDTLVTAIRAVRDTFALLNPGYAIRVHIGLRPLAKQIANWNSVRSVGAAADLLLRYSREVMADTLLPDTPTVASQALFDSLFYNAPDPIEPTVALPGLSQHGQLRAFDFKITNMSGRLVAGASSSAIRPVWEEQGWTARLKEAVDRACPGCFAGPLDKPYEPWHYTWTRGGNVVR